MYILLAVQLQIEEITRRLRTGELGIPLNPDDRFLALISCILLSVIFSMWRR